MVLLQGNRGRICVEGFELLELDNCPMDFPQVDPAILSSLAGPNQEIAENLIPVVYEELKRLARRYMQHERPDHTLQTTALVNEAYMKLVRQRATNFQSRSHFLGIAAQLMRRILVDHARGVLREKRGGTKETLPLQEAFAFSPQHSEELVRLHDALHRLARTDARQSRIVELRFFGGLSVDETAELLGISAKTVKRDWSVARAWLRTELRNSYGDFPKTMGPG